MPSVKNAKEYLKSLKREIEFLRNSDLAKADLEIDLREDITFPREVTENVLRDAVLVRARFSELVEFLNKL